MWMLEKVVSDNFLQLKCIAEPDIKTEQATSDVGGRQGSQSSSPPLAPVAQLQTFWGFGVTCAGWGEGLISSCIIRLTHCRGRGGCGLDHVCCSFCFPTWIVDICLLEPLCFILKISAWKPFSPLVFWFLLYHLTYKNRLLLIPFCLSLLSFLSSYN